MKIFPAFERNPPVAGNEHGIALLEVLIVAFLLSIALLGLATLQTSSLHFNNSAYQHTQATVLAMDMVERLRANPVGVEEQLYDNVDTGDFPPGSDFRCSDSCTPQELAKFDVEQWAARLNNSLPEARGEIQALDQPRHYNIRVSWYDQETAPLNAKCDAGTGSHHACVTLQVAL